MEQHETTSKIAHNVQGRTAAHWKYYRQYNGITHEEIRKVSGLSRPTIISIENNRDTMRSSFMRYLVAIELIIISRIETREKEEKKEQLEDENIF